MLSVEEKPRKPLTSGLNVHKTPYLTHLEAQDEDKTDQCLDWDVS